METGTKQRQAVKAFVKDWTGKGYEKGETQRFWLDLLHRVFGIDNPTQIMRFEISVKTITKEKGSDFIDADISTTKVLIEQKGSHVDLSAKGRQSMVLNLHLISRVAVMPPELRKAHRANDAAVLEAYCFHKDATESEIVARLFKMYQELTANS